MERFVIPGLFLVAGLVGIFAPYGPVQAVGVAIAATILILLALELAMQSVSTLAKRVRESWPFR